MKVTTGVDIIEVERIKKAIDELGENFLNRIYSNQEIEYCSKSNNMKYEHFAARFAVKEAVFKALSNYINGREDALWKEIEVINLESGKPELNVEKLKQKIEKTANNIQLESIDISISHIKDYAIANAVAIITDNNIELFDSHAHYNDEQFQEDREEVIQSIYKSGVTKLINAGYSLKSSKLALQIAKKYDWMYTIAGISPNDIPEGKSKLEQQLTELEGFITSELPSKKIVAIGEIGLDYYWEKDKLKQEIQRQVFIKQIELANKLNLPIVIHTRDAVMDTIEILKKYKVLNKGVFHCCPLNRELVKEALKLGFYISFAGPVTFKNSKNADEIIMQVPLDKILIETDSPYLAPEPKRGTRNDSTNVKYIAKKIAEVKQIDVNQIAKITYENASKIFKI